MLIVQIRRDFSYFRAKVEFKLCLACVVYVGDIGTSFVAVTFLSPEPVCVCACLHGTCVVVEEGRAMWSTLYCTVALWGQHFPSPCQSTPSAQHTSKPPPHPSVLTGRAHSGNRRSPNPSVTPWHVGSGLSIVAPCWAASLSHFLFCCPVW